MSINASDVLERVRAHKPVIHHLTNWVTIYDCANIVKVFGASPVMAHAKEEVADMAGIASALVLNIGTLTPDFIDAMKLAAIAANRKGIPVVLDVCGAGATKLRDDACFDILDSVKVNIIKGNASEIARIAGENVQTKGVDAAAVEKDLREVAASLAKRRSCTVVITGKEDIVADEEKVGAGEERPPDDGRYRRHWMHGSIGYRNVCRSREGFGQRIGRRPCLLRDRSRDSSTRSQRPGHLQGESVRFSVQPEL